MPQIVEPDEYGFVPEVQQERQADEYGFVPEQSALENQPQPDEYGFIPAQPTQGQTEETANKQEEDVVNFFGSPYLWVSKAKKRADSIDRTVDTLQKVATNKQGLSLAASLTGNAVKAGGAGLIGGAIDTLTSPANIGASIDNYNSQQSYLGLHGGEVGKGKDKKTFHGAESGIEGLKKRGFGRDAQRLEKFIKENPDIGKAKFPLIPSLTHFVSDLIDVKETVKGKDGKEYPVPLVKPMRLIGEVASGGLLKKGIEKGIEKGLLHSGDALNALQSFLKVTSSTDPKVLASTGVMGMMEDVIKWNGGSDGQALVGGIVSAVIADYAAKTSVNTMKAIAKLKATPEEGLFNLFQDYLVNSFTIDDSKIDLIKKYGGNLNLALATDDAFLKRVVDFVKKFGKSNTILKEGAKAHGKELENAFDKVINERLDQTLGEAAHFSTPSELGLENTVGYMNEPVRGNNVFSSAGSDEAVAFGGSLKTSVESNKISKQKQILADHKEANQQVDAFVKDVKAELKETEGMIRSTKESNVQEEIQQNVDTLYNHASESSNPQFAGEYAVDAFQLEKEVRKVKKNKLYESIDYGEAKGKPEKLLAYVESVLKSIISPIKSPDELAVIRIFTQFLEEAGVNISDKLKQKHGYAGNFELPVEVLLESIKLHTGKDIGKLRDFSAKELSSLVRSLGNILKHEEQIGVKKFVEGLKNTAESELESILINSGNHEALAQRKVANEYYQKEIIGKNYSTVGKGIVKGDLPKSPLSYMNSVDGVKLVQKTLGNSEQAKEAFRMLREAKIKELFLDKVRNADGTINVSKFQTFFNKNDKSQELLLELMGAERFNHFKTLARDTEAYHHQIMEEQLKRASEDAQIRLKSAENLKNGIVTRQDALLKDAKGSVSLAEVTRTRLEILKKLDNPDKLGKEAKQSLNEILKTTEEDIKVHFGDDSNGFKNYMLSEQEKVLQQRQDAYREFFGKGITNPMTETVNWGKLPSIMNDKTKRAYLENIAGKENLVKLEELSQWSSAIKSKMDVLNPSQTSSESAAIGTIKWTIKAVIGGVSSFVSYSTGLGTLGSATVGVGVAAAFGKKVLRATENLAEISAKVLSDPKFFDLALEIKNNPSLSRIEKFQNYIKARTGVGIQEINDLYLTALEEQVFQATD